MHAFVLALLLFTIAVVIMFIILAILHLTRSSTTKQTTVAPSLQEVYDIGDSYETNIRLGTNTVILNANQVVSGLPNIDIKPLKIVSKNGRVHPYLDTFAFVDAKSNITPFAQSQLVGFRFHTETPVFVVALQFILQLSTVATTHQVAIFDLGADIPVELTVPTDRTVNSATDTVQNGFATHFLQVPIPLVSFHEYAVVGLVTNATDFFLSSLTSIITPQQDILLDGGAESPNTTSIVTPTVFPDDIKHFFSFQTQWRQFVDQRIFDVDLVNGGYARYPPGYIRGFNVSVTEDGLNVIIDRGCGSSQFTDANLLLKVAVSIAKQQSGVNGLDQGTFTINNNWYHVYVIGSSREGLPTAGLLSLNRIEPLVPNGYDVFRRVGVVRYSSVTQAFDAMQQEGDGPSRTSIYLGSAALLHGFAQTFGETVGYIRANLGEVVPPTASQCLVSVVGTMVGQPGITPTNAVVRFRPSHATTEGIWNVGIPNERTTFGQVTVNLDDIYLPHEIEYRIFAEQGGSVPGGFFEGFRVDLFLSSFYETL